ncbi:FAD-dependent oxidoreductase [Sulfitobacter mediterraneus]|uniref:FAD-dependent oxidoreductase n=1 Tax=Sulfitobacter mediterraneus TaxID=83219 RepID=UPI0021A67D24|nr:FAD-dependent oxidoreductase [Sulfitobacter mediterraneus]UWR10328.1 FAD-dependent oxidoreductase [Sulfitobacter mediterraneus]
MSTMTKETDVLVVGCGIAGLSAAVTSLQNGAKVTVLERSPKEDFGGNTRWTEAYMRMKNDEEIADDFEEHFMLNAGSNIDPNVLRDVSGEAESWPAYVRAHNLPDPELISTFADLVPPTIAWLKEFGLKFGPQPIYLLTQNTHRIAAQGGGLALIERLNNEVSALGGEILYETTAKDLITDDTGRVTGAVCSDAKGEKLLINAKSTILASGGFQGNPEMMTHYIGPKAANIRPVARGGYYNRGEGIKMALELGAAPAGEFGSYHAEPVDPRSTEAEAVVFIYPYGILVDKFGQRFIDEAPGTVDAHYDDISRSFADQPDGIAYVIFDNKVEDIPRWKTSIRSDVPPIEADTIPALAEKLGIDVTGLAQTIEQFNAACPDVDEFKPFEIDNASTQGLSPNKSNWSRPLDAGPYRAFPMISSSCFTFGGLKVNPKSQVLDGDGKIIRGLLAAGETVGIYHQVYTGSTSVLRGAVFGRIAGETATT